MLLVQLQSPLIFIDFISTGPAGIMPICSTCHEDKLVEEFAKNRAKPDGLGSHCKSCQRLYSRAWYQENKETHKKATHLRKIRARSDCRAFLLSYLSGRRCVDCGEADPVVLEFDHIDPTSKKHEIAQMVSDGLSIKAVAIEIEKCEIRCANCHRRKTAAQLGWFRSTK